MTNLGLALIAVPAVVAGWAYLGYPLLLRIAASFGRRALPSGEPDDWPTVTILVPAHDEEDVIERTLRCLVGQDYPEERRQILVVSDASSDRTDEIVARWSDRGVELLVLPERRGKIGAQNAAASRFEGEIVVNFDAAGQLPPDAVRNLVRVFRDPGIGVASGRDVSRSEHEADANAGEAAYVGYEMAVRGLETATGSIVGASGSFYAVRRELFDDAFPDALCRDFYAVLEATERGYRSVSVEDARCVVGRADSLRSELERKTRTMARGLSTLWHGRRFLNPFEHGWFAVKLFSHKLARWLVPLTAPLALAGVGLLALEGTAGRLALGACAGIGAVGLAALRSADRESVRRPVAYCGYAVVNLLAGLRAWGQVLSGARHESWTPTRRQAPGGAA